MTPGSLGGSRTIILMPSFPLRAEKSRVIFFTLEVKEALTRLVIDLVADLQNLARSDLREKVLQSSTRPCFRGGGVDSFGIVTDEAMVLWGTNRKVALRELPLCREMVRNISRERSVSLVGLGLFDMVLVWV